MGAVKLKKEHANRVVGFNGSVVPLGERDDLDKLADIAVRSKDQSLLDLFDSVPTLKELEKAKSAKFLEDTKNTASTDEHSTDSSENNQNESKGK